VALGLHAAVKLFGQGGAGQDEVHAAAFLENKAEILDEMIDEESGAEIAIHDAGSERLHGHAACRAHGNKFMPLAYVEARLLGVDQGFADAEHDAGNGDLVCQFGLLAHAGSAAVQDFLSHDLKQGKDAGVALIAAADEDGQGRVHRAYVAACHRGIQGDDAAHGCAVRDFPCKGRARGCHVTQDGSCFHAVQASVGTYGHGFHVSGIAHHGEDDI